MTYKDSLASAMAALALDEKVRFVGYGVKYGRAGGSLAGIPDDRLVECPVAENLMAGLATGLSLAGFRPVVYYERFDFVLGAADAIVNHLDKLETLSRGEFKAGVILRVVVGNRRKPLFTGATHTQNFSEAFALILQMPVVEITEPAAVGPLYARAYQDMRLGKSTMLVEMKDLL